MYTRFKEVLTGSIDPHNISLKKTDIWEYLLLRCAGLNIKITTCETSDMDDVKGEMHLAIGGMSDDDALEFLKFLKKHDATACAAFVVRAHYVFNPSYCHYFYLNINNVIEKLIPVFNQQLEILLKTEPEAIARYQELSKPEPKKASGQQFYLAKKDIYREPIVRSLDLVTEDDDDKYALCRIC